MNTYGRDDILELVGVSGKVQRNHASNFAKCTPALADLITRDDFVKAEFTFEDESWTLTKVEKWSDCPPVPGISDRDDLDYEWDEMLERKGAEYNDRHMEYNDEL